MPWPQIIAGSELWRVEPDLQKAGNEAIQISLEANTARAIFAEEPQAVRALLGIDDDDTRAVVLPTHPYGRGRDLIDILAALLDLDDDSIARILAYVVAESLPCGGAIAEAVGQLFKVDMSAHWQPDDTFFELLRDKEAINAMVREIAGKQAADAHVSSTAMVQRKIIRGCLDGTRKARAENWQPRYMAFPMRAYTKRGGIAAIEQWNAIRKLFQPKA